MRMDILYENGYFAAGYQALLSSHGRNSAIKIYVHRMLLSYVSLMTVFPYRSAIERHTAHVSKSLKPDFPAI